MKAIETLYQGCRFRSRIEAKWAIFFDTLGIRWEYEKEGFTLEDGTWYLPDFWLPEQERWIEIKGQKPTLEEIKKCQLLAKALATDSSLDTPLKSIYTVDRESLSCVYILAGDIPFPPANLGYAVLCGYAAYSKTFFDHDHLAWAECLFCGKFELSWNGSSSCQCGAADEISKRIDWDYSPDNPMEFEIVSYKTEKWEHFFYTGDSPRLMAAYTAARSARFEHGEKG